MKDGLNYELLDVCVYCGKKCMTREQADGIIRVYKSKSRWRKFGKIPRRAYFCSDCGWWHVTSLRHSGEKRRMRR